MLEGIHRHLKLAHPDAEDLNVETQDPFVTGLAAAHPLENGFTFDDGAGVPYLPEPSINGLRLQLARCERRSGNHSWGGSARIAGGTAASNALVS